MHQHQGQIGRSHAAHSASLRKCLRLHSLQFLASLGPQVPYCGVIKTGRNHAATLLPPSLNLFSLHREIPGIANVADDLHYRLS